MAKLEPVLKGIEVVQATKQKGGDSPTYNTPTTAEDERGVARSSSQSGGDGQMLWAASTLCFFR